MHNIVSNVNKSKRRLLLNFAIADGSDGTH
jgi:hypothetical protein